MSLLWAKVAAFDNDERLPINIEGESVPPRKPGYLWTARVPHDHPLAKEHGTLAGYAHVEQKPDPDDPGGYVHHIHMLEVNPGYAHQGVGSRLLQHVIRKADYDSGVSHDGFTPAGARLWQSVTGEEIDPTRKADLNNKRTWRYA